jgi:hypothetical protein
MFVSFVQRSIHSYRIGRVIFPEVISDMVYLANFDRPGLLRERDGIRPARRGKNEELLTNVGLRWEGSITFSKNLGIKCSGNGCIE